MKIHQSVFIRDLIIEKKLTNYNANVIPMKTGLSIKMSDPKDHKKPNLYTYQRLIGKLMYLSYSIRPDISFVVGQLSRHNADPRKRHLHTAKRGIRYLKRIIKIEQIFDQKSGKQLPRDPSPYGLVSYIDNNFFRDSKDQKLVMGHCFFLNRVMVSWSSKK